MSAFVNKALRKTEFSKFFNFASFGIVRLPKFRNFSEKPGFCEKSLGQKPCYWVQKKPVFKAKTGVLGSKTGVSEFTEYLEFVLFRIFQKLQENDVKIKKLVPTRIFEFEFGMQGLICQAM